MTTPTDNDRMVHIFLLEAVGEQMPPDVTDRVLRQTGDAPRLPLRRVLLEAALVLLMVVAWAVISQFRYPSPTGSGSYHLVDGGKLQRGSVVAADGPVELSLGGYCRLNLESDSRLRLQGSDKAEGIYLEEGPVTCDVDRHVGTFAVLTDFATVSVTGTKFTVCLVGDEEMTTKILWVKVLVGTVVLSGAWGSTPIQAGQSSAATNDGGNPPSVFGTITKVGDSSITLQPYKGKSTETVTVSFDNSTTIVISQKPAQASDLKVGMHAGAWVVDGKPATKIFAYMPKPPSTQPSGGSTEPKCDVFGTITNVGDSSITLQPYKSTETVTVSFDNSTTIIISQKPAQASDLKVGMHAAAWVQPGKPATKISAYMPKPPSTQPSNATPSNTTSSGGNAEIKPNVYGTITKVGSGSMTVQIYNSTETAVVAFDGDTTFIIGKNKEPGKASDLKVGMHAAAWVQSGQPATKISAYMHTSSSTQPTPGSNAQTGGTSTSSKPDGYGTITKVTSNSITLQDAKSSRTATVTYGASTNITVGGQAATGADLKVGMRAAVWLKAGTATKISAYMPTKHE